MENRPDSGVARRHDGLKGVDETLGVVHLRRDARTDGAVEIDPYVIDATEPPVGRRRPVEPGGGRSGGTELALDRASVAGIEQHLAAQCVLAQRRVHGAGAECEVLGAAAAKVMMDMCICQRQACRSGPLAVRGG